MNPQMQNYRQYPPAQQGRQPVARRPVAFPGRRMYRTVYFPAQQSVFYPPTVFTPPAFDRPPPIPVRSHARTGQVHPNAHYAQQQAQIQSQQAQHRHAVLEHQQAQRRAKKPTDQNMPDGIEDFVIGDGVQQYKDLREAEKRLDYSIMRKRMDLQDIFARTVKRQRTLRLWISNTVENQHWQGGGLDENTFDFSAGSDASYRVTIEGRLLDDPEDEVLSDDEDETTEKPKEATPPSKVPKMSHFFKSMTVEFDRTKTNISDPGVQVEWKKQAGSADIDEIAFTRRGDENQNISIDLVRDEQPERYRLSHALSQTLDMEEGDRAEVVMGIWEYVKAMGLQEDEEKRSIRCDEALRQIFGREQIYFPQIPDQIMQHLHPLPPIRLPYTIRVDEAYVNSPTPTIYDITVTTEDPTRLKIATFLQNTPGQLESLQKINRATDDLAMIIQAIMHSKSKHNFLKSLNKDPVGFVKKWIASQKRDLEVILGEAARGGGEDGLGVEFGRGGTDGVWGTDVVREATRYAIARPVVGKNL